MGAAASNNFDSNDITVKAGLPGRCVAVRPSRLESPALGRSGEPRRVLAFRPIPRSPARSRPGCATGPSAAGAAMAGLCRRSIPGLFRTGCRQDSRLHGPVVGRRTRSARAAQRAHRNRLKTAITSRRQTPRAEVMPPRPVSGGQVPCARPSFRVRPPSGTGGHRWVASSWRVAGSAGRSLWVSRAGSPPPPSSPRPGTPSKYLHTVSANTTHPLPRSRREGAPLRPLV
jgi:hypothetical protein